MIYLFIRNNLTGMKKTILYLLLAVFVLLAGCSHVTYRILSKPETKEDEDPEPIYDITLDEDYQNFIEYMFIGNRSEGFGTYFNKYFSAMEDFDEGMKEYQTSFIANYNPRIDSLDVVPRVSLNAK